MSDPDYPMDEFVYDLIMYGYEIKNFSIFLIICLFTVYNY